MDEKDSESIASFRVDTKIVWVGDYMPIKPSIEEKDIEDKISRIQNRIIEYIKNRPELFTVIRKEKTIGVKIGILVEETVENI